MAAMNAVIEHLCANQEHQLPADVASPVIAYADRWGYCPAGVAEGHDWRATGGRTLATVREWLGRPPTVERDKESKTPESTVRG